MLSLMEMLNVFVLEILSELPSAIVYGVSMGFVNKLTLLYGKRSL